MNIIPAIDLLDGKVVRLFQGDYNKVTNYDKNPVSQAQYFKDCGAKRIHIVDLNGAKTGIAINRSIIEDICKNVDIDIEVGGGIRDEETIKAYFDLGVDYTILGTKAIMDSDFLADVVSKYGDKIIAGVDTKNGFATSDGWINSSEKKTEEIFNEFEKIGVKNIIYTDIKTDGALTGLNRDNIEHILSLSGVNITISGGVSSIDDISLLKTIKHSNLFGIIIGKAIYDGRIDIKEAISI